MSIYSYSARAKNGKLVRGSYEGADRETVVMALKSRGFLPIKIREKKQGFDLSFLSSKVPVKDISIFCRQFATVLEAGIPITESLDIIRKQTESKSLREILNNVYTQVQKGSSLSSSMRRYSKQIPPILINMIEAGETSGTLDRVMQRMSDYFINQNKMIRKVKGAMTYPAVIACTAVLAVIGMLKFVVPQFTSMYSSTGNELPASTQLLVTLSDIVGRYFVLVLLGIIGLVVGTIYYLKTPNGKLIFDSMLFKIPKVSKMYRKMIAARFSRTMASLLFAGIPLLSAIEITERVLSNALMSKYLKSMAENISKGTKLSNAVAQVPYFTAMLQSMITIGEESGALDGLLDKTADFYEEETEAEVESLTTLLEPMIIIVMAVLIGGIVISMVQPMFGMFDTISSM